MLCLATVGMCADGKVDEHALLRDSLVLCALLLFGVVFSQVHTHTHTRDGDALEQWRRQLW
jgi:hypothetical protein